MKLKRSLKSKIRSPQSLKRNLSQLKRKKIVFTNGCFDLLHKGHVTYLERARNAGDILVVALNTDRSVQEIKGPSRPINPLENRLEVLAALESVDFVTWFDESTPESLIQKLKPDVYAKGGDWKVKDLPEAPLVRSWGGKVKIIKYLDGHSTTALIAKSKKNK